jgi:hypothetical protein
MHWFHFKWDVQEKMNEVSKRREQKIVNERAWWVFFHLRYYKVQNNRCRWWLHVITIFLAANTRHFSSFYYVFCIKIRGSCINTKFLGAQEKKEKERNYMFPAHDAAICWRTAQGPGKKKKLYDTCARRGPSCSRCMHEP